MCYFPEMSNRSFSISIPSRGPEDSAGGWDPLQAEGHGEGNREEDFRNRRFYSYVCLLVCGNRWDCVCNAHGDCGETDEPCVLTDAAFLAREKARADAEYYTAEKLAEANKVISFINLAYQCSTTNTFCLVV